MKRQIIISFLITLSLKVTAQEEKRFLFPSSNITKTSTNVFPLAETDYLFYSVVINTSTNPTTILGFELKKLNQSLVTIDSLFIEKNLNGVIQKNDSTFLICSAIDTSIKSNWEVYFLQDNFTLTFFKSLKFDSIPNGYRNYLNKVERRNNQFYIVAQVVKPKTDFYMLTLDENLNVVKEFHLEKNERYINDYSINDSSAVFISSIGDFYDKNWNYVNTVKQNIDTEPTLEKPGFTYGYMFDVEYFDGIYNIIGSYSYDSVYTQGTPKLFTDLQVGLYQYSEAGTLLNYSRLGQHNFNEDIQYNSTNQLTLINDNNLFVTGKIYPTGSTGDYTQVLSMRIYTQNNSFSRNNNQGEVNLHYYPYGLRYIPKRKEIIISGMLGECTLCEFNSNFIMRFKEDFLQGINQVNTQLTNKLVIYPNPSSTEVSIKLNTTPYDLIELYNIQGEKIRAIPVEMSQTKITFPTMNLTNGSYFLKSWYKGKVNDLSRFIIQH